MDGFQILTYGDCRHSLGCINFWWLSSIFKVTAGLNVCKYVFFTPCVNTIFQSICFVAYKLEYMVTIDRISNFWWPWGHSSHVHNRTFCVKILHFSLCGHNISKSNGFQMQIYGESWTSKLLVTSMNVGGVCGHQGNICFCFKKNCYILPFLLNHWKIKSGFSIFIFSVFPSYMCYLS